MMRENWMLGFLGFMGIRGIQGLLSGNLSEAIWIVWFVWFIYFFLRNLNKTGSNIPPEVGKASIRRSKRIANQAVF